MYPRHLRAGALEVDVVMLAMQVFCPPSETP
jgi:hypothetical protein